MIKNIYKLIKKFFVSNKNCFLVIALVITSVITAYSFGVSNGKQKQAITQATQTINALNQLINSTEQLTKNAVDASSALSQQMAERKLYDEQSTNALRDALNSTATNRSNCVFDDRVLQFIDSARTRAAEATTHGFTSTTDGTMRITRKTTK
ncbi:MULTISPECIES: hypothetical protein [unclassified Gilliamella]|uniref:hypothetical protein n=1 Tax=unclassified Gilliamella TaxID=2685620 RepID=UPI0018DD2B1D|nr:MULTISPECIES: hypothetical protein [unclassified Gilliamella]MBI0114223.1 hypothetical protein [Gilliamella sp. W8123]MBI0117760.1 hypothetical protein [Gilliamella sp. W8129]